MFFMGSSYFKLACCSYLTSWVFDSFDVDNKFKDFPKLTYSLYNIQFKTIQRDAFFKEEKLDHGPILFFFSLVLMENFVCLV